MRTDVLNKSMLKKVDTEGKQVDANRRNCIDCDVDISKRGGGTKRCVQCAEIRAEQLKEKRVIKDWKNKGMPTCETVTGQPCGITLNQNNYLLFLMEFKSHDFKELINLAIRDSVIRDNKNISDYENLTINQASKLIDYLSADRAMGDKKLYTQWLQKNIDSKTKVEAVEKPIKIKLCIDCDADISMRGATAVRCVVCAEVKKGESKKDRDINNRQIYIAKRKADAVSGDSYGITKKQLNFLTHLLETTGYEYSDIMILAKREGVIKRKEETPIESISSTEASRLIEYLLGLRDYLDS